MRDLNALPLDELLDHFTREDLLCRLLDLARDEDLGKNGDVTTASIISKSRRGGGNLVAREPGVIAGLACVTKIIKAFNADIEFKAHVQDGTRVDRGRTLGELGGSLRDLLAVERTMLNLVSRLSGVATQTRRYVEAVSGIHAVICDTRKTTPGLRILEKYAVRCGSGTLHRVGLFDAVLYKDNHLAHIPRDELTREVSDACRMVREKNRLKFVEVEVDSLDMFERILACEQGLIDIVLLDNMSVEGMKRAVMMRDESNPSLLLEASGGVTLETIKEIAATGVDRISIGGLTHHAVSLDVAFDIQPSRA
jgi:nicotinate-nucleotide pyrophosphorylase (carboxylating)